MKLPILTINNYETHKQQKKIIEEWNEFWAEGTGTTQEVLEALDLIQTLITYLHHEHKPETIADAIQYHNYKLKERRYTINKVIEFEIKDF